MSYLMQLPNGAIPCDDCTEYDGEWCCTMNCSRIDYTPAELELRQIERDRRMAEAKVAGRLDGRAWFDPDAGKQLPKVDRLPPNLCGFHNLMEADHG